MNNIGIVGNAAKQIEFKDCIKDFLVPEELKNDIMYCQQYLRIYLKAHQVLTKRFGEGAMKIPIVRTSLNEIEQNIYEINAEQKYALLRLRRVIDLYYQSLDSAEVRINRNVGNEYIFRTFLPLFDDTTFVPNACSVRKRPSEVHILRLYDIPEFIAEPADIDMQSEVVNIVATMDPPPHLLISGSDSGLSKGTPASQVSLLKPKSERVSIGSGGSISQKSSPNGNCAGLLRKSLSDQTGSTTSSHTDSDQKLLLNPASSVNRSRLNLRQALNKAKTAQQQQQHQVKPIIVPSIIANKKSNNTHNSNAKPIDYKKMKSLRKSNGSCSSEDSNEIREFSPIIDECPEPQEYNQEMFMKIFELFTHDQIAYMQQRRSKRKRRTVQSTEKTDYHYGHIDFDNTIQSGESKRRKTLLLSPPGLKVLKKITNIETAPIKMKELQSRSSSRSASPPPVKKFNCNECNKAGTDVVKCQKCKSYFHETCHDETLPSMLSRDSNCPSCCTEEQSSPVTYISEMNNENSKKSYNLALKNEVKHLAMKRNQEQNLNRNLLKKSEIYKREMNNLFGIVEKIKTFEKN